MTFPQFTLAVDNLVKSWALDEPDYRAVPRDALKEIYDKVREQAVKDCADWVEQRNKALEIIHDHYTKQ